MKRKSTFVLVAVLLLALVAPARADTLSDLRKKQDATKSKRTQITKRLDVLKASDDDLDRAMGNLKSRIVSQENSIIAAQQAAGAAQETVRQAEAALAVTDGQVSKTRKLLADRAISIYMNPVRDSLFDVISAKSLAEASRRQALLSHVISNDRVLIDQLRAVREDLDQRRSGLAKARDIARQRREAALDGLRALQSTQTEQDRVKKALDARIASFIAETEAVDREQASITALIRQRQGTEALDIVSSSGLIWPIRGPVTSGFGMRWGRMHTGIDIGAGTGTPIKAAKSGTVIMASWNGGYGNCVIISHGGGFSTLYGHQSRMAVSDGAHVSQGQVIGYVGSTGHSTGPHLHFETRVNGEPQNPRKYLK